MQFTLVCIDDAYIPEVQEHYRLRDPSFNPGFFEQDLRAFTQSIDVGFLGLHSMFEYHYRQTGVPLHFGEWDRHTDRVQTGHWNYEGHRVVADALVVYLLGDSLAGNLVTSSLESAPR